tara:strand:+ start:34644 stop:34853 length:210 start_codon:yes stop_codon:yes gene_type:complete
MRQRNRQADTADLVTGYAFIACIVVLIGLFWYFFSIGVVVTYDKKQCNRMNIGETCVILVRPERLVPLL